MLVQEEMFFWFVNTWLYIKEQILTTYELLWRLELIGAYFGCCVLRCVLVPCVLAWFWLGLLNLGQIQSSTGIRWRGRVEKLNGWSGSRDRKCAEVCVCVCVCVWLTVILCILQCFPPSFQGFLQLRLLWWRWRACPRRGGGAGTLGRVLTERFRYYTNS